MTMASEAGQLQLNVMEPVIAYSLLTSIRLLTRGYKTLREKCVVGITANPEVCVGMVNNSIGIVTVRVHKPIAALARSLTASISQG
eukprot:COSAG05_NODE_466_length_9533_cov_5.547806_8_plen_86_part_00